MTRKRAQKAFARNNVYKLEKALVENGRAWEEGPKRKTWTRHDLNAITPMTPNQEEMFHDFMAGQNICAHGSAGTGKTYVAIFLALNEILNPKSDVNKLMIVRSAVSTRDVGHLPGTLEEKTMLYEAPYKDMFTDFMGRPATYQDMKEAGLVEFLTTSFIRGVTWDDCIIVVDEAQNMSFHEINTIMTRLGRNSRIIIVGDTIQTDLRKKGDESGMPKLLEVTHRMGRFTNIQFNRHDIVRSEFVKQWITAVEDYDLGR